MPGYGRLLLVAGLISAVLFFMLAPRSPARTLVPEPYEGLVGTMDIACGVAGLLLILSGYALFLFEEKPRPIAMYRLASFLVLLLWTVAANVVYNYMFAGRGVVWLLASLTMTLPIIPVAYYVFLRRMEERARRTVFAVIPPRRGKG